MDRREAIRRSMMGAAGLALAPYASGLTLPEGLDYLASDKKNDNGRFIFSLINDIGNSVIDADVSKNEVIKSLDYYRACHM